jgi:beta-glucosidase
VNAGVDYGKLHGSKTLLTDALKLKMGFDGFVISDWNGIAQVPGCSESSCAQAINAGIDMVMVPDHWRAFIATTIKQVQRGEIPMTRIDDAVSRILRVKLRAGMFGKKPSGGIYAGKPQALLARDLARQAVRQSLVLLKNNQAILPLVRGKKILVVGKSADSIQNQTGGWSLSWQGTENQNNFFPNADSILDGIKEVAGSANVVFRMLVALMR